MTGDTMREAMEAAFDGASDEEEQEETGGSPAEPEEPLGAAEAGEEAQAEAVIGEEPGAPAEPAGEGDEPLPIDAAPEGDAQPLGGDSPAPVSWTPAAREHWGGIPPQAQEEIIKREGDIARGLQQASGHKRVADEYFKTVAPFQQYIQAAGSTPAQAITELMTTASQLTAGSPAKKAQVVQNIINEYGVDITMLDSLLAGQPVADDPNAPLLASIDERLAPINDFMGTVHQGRQEQAQEVTQEASTELGTFQQAHSEFYEDLREDMADLMEMATNRGRTMSLDQAYDHAANAHPEIGPILKQRVAAEAGKLDPASAAAKRNAASSIRGSANSGGGPQADGSDTRALMSELWDDAAGDVGHG
ncbi:MAG: hypothetical protein GQ553_05010 [Nitrosomonadaceae bacterium]|nr:hypothetical protein [Nitrosomonadaceae bacterium]